ncbi:DUF4148 domain-containing protein [Burkholderia guangdongensis]|uniref:DUF4148 domain-containing protein n=1 Tax=Burkholderia guangdongensis TaxID=1792500 RepID=UPI0015C9C740|nr:DUF4148 domain-containing protein [Burkholderia guangdongensis]
MKSLAQAAVIAAALAVPAVSFAQSNAPLTRAQVRAELIQLEQAGYRPGLGSDPTYPDSIQAATARVAAKNTMAQTRPVADTSGYGADAHGASGSGSPRMKGPLPMNRSSMPRDGYPTPSLQNFSGS